MKQQNLFYDIEFTCPNCNKHADIDILQGFTHTDRILSMEVIKRKDGNYYIAETDLCTEEPDTDPSYVCSECGIDIDLAIVENAHLVKWLEKRNMLKERVDE